MPNKMTTLGRFASLLFVAFLAGDSLAGTGPRIHCSEPEYRFGDRPTTGSVEHVFLIENKGDAPLQIAGVRACCGADARIGAQVLAPGSNANLTATLPMAGRRGVLSKSFYVASNDPGQPYYQIRMSGNGVAEAYVEPPIVDFGDAVATNDAPRTVRLVCSSNATLSVTNVVVDSPAFTVKSEKTPEGFALLVAVASPLKPGVTHGNMRILTDSKAYPRFDVHLTAASGCDIQLVPGEIALVVAAGKVEPVTRYLAVRSKKGTPFKVLGVDVPAPGIEAKVDALPSGGWRVQLTGILPSSDLDGKRFAVRTDRADAREIPVPIRVAPKP